MNTVASLEPPCYDAAAFETAALCQSEKQEVMMRARFLSIVRKAALALSPFLLGAPASLVPATPPAVLCGIDQNGYALNVSQLAEQGIARPDLANMKPEHCYPLPDGGFIYHFVGTIIVD